MNRRREAPSVDCIDVLHSVFRVTCSVTIIDRMKRSSKSFEVRSFNGRKKTNNFFSRTHFCILFLLSFFVTLIFCSTRTRENEIRPRMSSTLSNGIIRRELARQKMSTPKFGRQNINHNLTGGMQTLHTHALHLVGIFVGQIAPLLKSARRAPAPYCLAIHHATVSCYCYGNLYSRQRLLCHSRLRCEHA